MEREKTCIVDDLHARGWDEREDTGQTVSCTGSVTLRGPNVRTCEVSRVVRVVWAGTVTESPHIRTSFALVSLAQPSLYSSTPTLSPALSLAPTLYLSQARQESQTPLR